MAQQMNDTLSSAQQEGTEPIQPVPLDPEHGRLSNNSSNENLSDSDGNKQNVFKLLRNKKSRLKTIFNPLALSCAVLFVPLITMIILVVIMVTYEADQVYGKGYAWDKDATKIFMLSAIILLILDGVYVTAGISYYDPRCCCRKFCGWEVIIDGEDQELEVSDEEKGVGYGDDRENLREDNSGKIGMDPLIKNVLY